MKTTTAKESQPVKLGKGNYQLTSLNVEVGQPVLRNMLSRGRQLELLSNPKGNSDYVAQSILLRTDFQVKDNVSDLNLLKTKLKQLVIPEEDRHVVAMVMHAGVNYAVIDLDEFGVILAASEQNPDEYFWIQLLNEDKHIIGHMVFRNQQLTIFSDYPINISGQENDIKTLVINTMCDVLIEKPLRTIQTINIFCRTVTMISEQTTELVKTGSAHFLCFHQCFISESTQLITTECQIKTGHVIHKGHIESEQSTQIVAELAEVHGMIAAKGKKGITVISLGLAAYDTSHLHGSVVNIIMGSQNRIDLIYWAYLVSMIKIALPFYDCLNDLIMEYLDNDQKNFIDQVRLAGLISGAGLNIFANQVTLLGKCYVQGNIALYAAGSIGKVLVEKTAKIFFNGKFFRQQSQLGAWIDGAVMETLVEVYWKKVIDPSLTLTKEESLRSQIPQVLVSRSPQTSTTSASLIEFLPVLSEREDYLYKPYDKTKFDCLEKDIIKPKPEEEKTHSQIIFSGEYLSVTGYMPMSSSQVTLEGVDLQLSGHFENISFMGCVDLLLKSENLDLRGAVIDMNDKGSVTIAAQTTQIVDSQIAAEKIAIETESLSFLAKLNSSDEATEMSSVETSLSAAKITIKSEHNSSIAKKSKLTLSSPEPVSWQCENFYHRGTLEFQQLSIKAEHLVSVVFAKMQGKRLDLDTYYLVAGLSSFKINTFSVQSVVSLIGLCHIASDFYCNTSIINLSLALYTPATLSLSMKSGIALALAAANTTISILQLVLHEPTCQLALTAARLGINAGPALYQAYQLAKDIHSTTQATQITRGILIKIANQTKTLLLSLGALAYGGAGLAKQFMHICQLQNMPVAANNWNNVLSTINNLNSVVTPLLSMMFPGKHVSSFFNADLDISAGFSSTNYNLFDIHGGIDSSLMASRSSVFDVAPNPLSLNLSPILSTNTSIYSISSAQESVLPIGSHSERTQYKTYVDTGVPPLAQYTSLSTHELTFLGSGEREFKKSSLQADDVLIAKESHIKLTDSSFSIAHKVVHDGEAKFDHSQITAKEWESILGSAVSGKQSQFKTDSMFIEKTAKMEFADSVISVSHPVENSGEAKFTHSLVSTDHWQSDKDSTTLFQQSQFQGTLDNHGAVEFIQTKVDGEIHNHDGASLLAVNSALNLKITDDHGATTQIIASELKTHGWQESGLFSAHTSDIKGEGVNIKKDAQVGSLVTNWEMSGLTSEVDIPVDLQGTHFTAMHSTEADHQHGMHHHHAHHHGHKDADVQQNPEVKPVAFKYVDDSKLSGSLEADGMHYHAEEPLEIKDINLISAIPVHIKAPELTVSGQNTSTTSISLTGIGHVSFDHSHTIVSGSLEVQGGDVVFKGGQTAAGGALTVQSTQEGITLQKSAQLFAKEEVELDSKTKFISRGEKIVETHTEEHDHFLRTDKIITTTTRYVNNQIVSGNSDVTVHSGTDMLFKGTDIAGQNITADAKKDIEMTALTGTDSVSKDHSNYLGGHHDQYQQTADTASPNHFVAEKKLTFVTPGDVHNIGSELSAKEEIKYVLSKDSHVTNSALILNGHTEETHTGFGFHSFAGMTLPFNTHQYVSQLPLVQDSQQLAQAATLDDKLSAIVHLSTDAVNTTNSVLAATRQGGIMGGLEQLLLPNLNLTCRFGKSTLRADHQWVRPGSITTEHVWISAKDASFSNNFGISAKSSYLDLDEVSSTGAHLHNSVIAKDSFVTFSLSATALLYPSLSSVNVGLSHSYQSSIQDVWQGDAMHWGDLTLRANTAIFYGSQWTVNSITGDLNTLIADAAANVLVQTAYHASLSSSGSFSFGNNEKFETQAAMTTPFVGEKSEPYATEYFSIGTFISHGEKITDIHPSHSEFTPIYEVKKEHGFDISGSGRDLMFGHHSPSQVFSTWDFHLTQHDYLARRDQDFTVLRDDDSHIGFTVPIYHPAAGKALVDNMNWLMAQPHFVPTEVKAVQQMPEIKHAVSPAKILTEKHGMIPIHTTIPESLPTSTIPDPLDFAASYEKSQDLQTLLNINFDDTPLQSEVKSGEENNSLASPWLGNMIYINEFDPLFDPDQYRYYLQSLQPILDIDFSNTPFSPYDLSDQKAVSLISPTVMDTIDSSEKSILDLNFDEITTVFPPHSLPDEKSDSASPWLLDTIDPLEMFDPLFDPVWHRNYLQRLQPILDMDFSNTPFLPQQETTTTILINSHSQDNNSFKDHLTTAILSPTSAGIGALTEALEYDSRWLSTVYENYEVLVKSSAFQSFLTETQKNVTWSNKVFMDYSDEILAPYMDWLRLGGSYLEYNYFPVSDTQFIPESVFRSDDIFAMVDQTTQEFGNFARGFHKLVTPMRMIHMAPMIAMDIYMIAYEKESLLKIIEKDEAAIGGSLFGGSLASIAARYFKTNDNIRDLKNFYEEVVKQGSVAEAVSTMAKSAESAPFKFKDMFLLLRGFAMPWNALPLAGMVAGGILGDAFVAGEDNEVSMSTNFSISYELWHAAGLRQQLSDKFRAAIEPFYDAPKLANTSVALYEQFFQSLEEQSTAFGRSLANHNAISRFMLDMLPLTERVTPSPMSIPTGEFSIKEFWMKYKPKEYIESLRYREKFLTDNFPEFSLPSDFEKLLADDEIAKKALDIDGPHFRSLIDKASDFSPEKIAHYQRLSTFLFGLAAVDAGIQLINSDDKIQTTEHIVSSLVAGNIGWRLGALLGSVLIAPEEVLAIGGVAFLGSVAGNFGADAVLENKETILQTTKHFLLEKLDTISQSIIESASAETIPPLDMNFDGIPVVQPILDLDFSDTPFLPLPDTMTSSSAFSDLYAVSQPFNPEIIFSVDFTENNSNDNLLLEIKAGLMPGELPHPSAEGIQSLWRGTMSDTDKVFDQGFTARGKNEDLIAHAAGEERALESAFISTSRSFEAASKFPRPPFETGLAYLYKIQSLRPTVDVAEALIPKIFSSDVDVDDYMTYRNEQESAFREKIFGYEIEGALKVNLFKQRIHYPEDLSYITSSWSQEAIDEHCFDYNRTMGEFIPNPNFISPDSIEKIWDVTRGFGYLLTGVGLTFDGLSLYHEFRDSKETGNYANTYREGSRIAGGWTGAGEAGWLAAKTSLTICAPLKRNPYAEAGCVLAVTLAGSALGYYGGSKLVTEIYDGYNSDHDTLLKPLQLSRYFSHEKLDKIFLKDVDDLLIKKPETSLLTTDDIKPASTIKTETGDNGNEISIDFAAQYTVSQQLDSSAIFAMDTASQEEQKETPLASISVGKTQDDLTSTIFYSSAALGAVTEVLEYDKRLLTDLYKNFELLVKSPEFKSYLITGQKELIWDNEIFKHYSSLIFSPYIDWLNTNASYLYSNYLTVISDKFIADEIYSKSNIFAMVDQNTKSFGDYVSLFAKSITPMRALYAAPLLAENIYAVGFQGESLSKTLEKDEAVIGGSILGGGIVDHFITRFKANSDAKELRQSFHDLPQEAKAAMVEGWGTTLEEINKVAPVKLTNALSFLKGFFLPWNILPLAGMVGGGFLMETLTGQEDSEVSFTANISIGRELWHAASLRGELGHDLRTAIEPLYYAPKLSNGSPEVYDTFWTTLTERSTPFGRSLAYHYRIFDDVLDILPLKDQLASSAAESMENRNIITLLQEMKKAQGGVLSEEYERELNHAIGKAGSGKAFAIDSPQFRSLIDTLSDFAPGKIAALKYGSISLLGLSVLDAIEQLATSDHKGETAGRLAFTLGVGDVSWRVGALVGAALFGPELFVVSGVAFISAVAGNIVADKAWAHRDAILQTVKDTLVDSRVILSSTITEYQKGAIEQTKVDVVTPNSFFKINENRQPAIPTSIPLAPSTEVSLRLQ